MNNEKGFTEEPQPPSPERSPGEQLRSRLVKDSQRSTLWDSQSNRLKGALKGTNLRQHSISTMSKIINAAEQTSPEPSGLKPEAVTVMLREAGHHGEQQKHRGPHQTTQAHRPLIKSYRLPFHWPK